MNDNNLKEAPIISQRETMLSDIKSKSKEILKKYFEGREYNEDKVNLWKEYSLEDISNYLTSKYKDYGFIILIMVINTLKCGSNCQTIKRNNTDETMAEYLDTSTMRAEIRITFYKIYKTENLIENIKEKIVLKMNNILINKIENKKFSYKIATNTIKEICEDINNFLLERKPLPCSNVTCYLNQKPMNFQFEYKVINLKYIPLMVTYSNDSLYAQIILFILNN